MNQTQKNYTLRRIQDIAASKKVKINCDAQDKKNEAAKRIKPEAWKQMNVAQKANAIDKAVKAKKLKIPKALAILNGINEYEDRGLPIIWPGVEKIMADVNAESVATRKIYEKEEKKIMTERSKRHNILNVSIIHVNDEIMLGDDAEQAIEALAKFEKQVF